MGTFFFFFRPNSSLKKKKKNPRHRARTLQALFTQREKNIPHNLCRAGPNPSCLSGWLCNSGQYQKRVESRKERDFFVLFMILCFWAYAKPGLPIMKHVKVPCAACKKTVEDLVSQWQAKVWEAVTLARVHVLPMGEVTEINTVLLMNNLSAINKISKSVQRT